MTTLHRLIVQARQSSRALHQPHVLCHSNDGTTCARASRWRSLIVRNDVTGRVIARHDIDARLTLVWRGFQPTLKFHPLPWHQALNGRFIACLSQYASYHPVQLILNAMGRVRRETGDTSQCAP